MLCKIKAQSNGSMSTSIRPEIEQENCSRELYKINNHCYIVSNQTVTGFAGLAFCPNRYPGSHLAKIDSDDDFKELQNILTVNYNSSFRKIWVNDIFDS